MTMKTQIIKFLEGEKDHCKIMASRYRKALRLERNPVNIAAIDRTVSHFEGRLKQIEETLKFINP